MSFNFTWNAAFEALPADSEDIRLGAGRIRDLKSALTERLSVDHSLNGDDNDGAHDKVTLLEQVGDPTYAVDTGFLYTKAVNGNTELFYEDETGAITQITSHGGSGAITGEVRSIAFTSYPLGWLPCDGSAVSRTTYANLYTVIGNTFGAGDGVSTFNVPDMRGRTVVGAGTGSGLTARTTGQSIGAETSVPTGSTDGHALTVAELASHNHAPLTGTGFAVQITGHDTVVAAGNSIWTNGSATTANTGSGNAHSHTLAAASVSTIPPAVVLYWIIKT